VGARLEAWQSQTLVARIAARSRSTRPRRNPSQECRQSFMEAAQSSPRDSHRWHQRREHHLSIQLPVVHVKRREPT
jgi:hypothetical protein